MNTNKSSIIAFFYGNKISPIEIGSNNNKKKIIPVDDKKISSKIAKNNPEIGGYFEECSKNEN